jgi:hypothetical protein
LRIGQIFYFGKISRFCGKFFILEFVASYFARILRIGQIFYFRNLVVLAANFLSVHSGHFFSADFADFLFLKNWFVLAASFLREKSGNVSREFFWN